MLKRRLIAMLLCIAMIGSMTVYAVGDDTTCTCGTENDVHAEDCALLAEPETEPEPVCTCATENDVHADTCPLYVAPVPECTCATENDVHADTCPLYAAPIDDEEDPAEEKLALDLAPAPETSTLFEKLMALETLEELEQMLLEYQFENEEELNALTADQINALFDRVDELDPQGTSSESETIVDLLINLPNFVSGAEADGEEGAELANNVYNVTQNKWYDTLSAAVAAAANGNIIEVHNSFTETASVKIQKQNLTIRAAAGKNPTISWTKTDTVPVTNATSYHCVVIYTDVTTSTTFGGSTGTLTFDATRASDEDNKGSRARVMMHCGKGTLNIKDGIVLTGGNTGGGTYESGKGQPGSGEITNVSGYGSGLYMYSGTLLMSGGRIENNYSLWGKTTDHNFVGGGGGVFLNAGTTMTMSGGTIHHNAAGSGGGAGILVGTGSTLTVTNGTISENVCRFASGGGIGVQVGSIVKIQGGHIKDNVVEGHGGGLFARGDSVPLEITGGIFENNTAGSYGGGVLFWTVGDDVTKNTVKIGGNVQIINNTALDGAGVSVGREVLEGKPIGNKAKLVITGNPIISGNVASRNGGGIQMQSDEFSDAVNTVEISGGTFSNNRAKDGAGIYVPGGTVTMTGGSFSGNKASNRGAGIFTGGGTVTLTGATFDTNEAQGNGGGLYVVNGAVNMNSGTFSENKAANGGALYVTGGNVKMYGGTMTDNEVPGNGGALYVGSGTFTMISGTMTGNKATGDTSYGGAAYVTGGSILIGVENCKYTQENADGNHTVAHTDKKHPVISGNSAQDSGGGLAVVGSGDITMHCGQIKNNTAPNRGRGLNVYMEEGTFDFNGGDLGSLGEPELVIVGGELMVDEPYINLEYYHCNISDHQANHTGDLSKMSAAASNNSDIHLPDGEKYWDAAEGYRFFGWTFFGPDNDAVKKQVRSKSDYKASGAPIHVTDGIDGSPGDETIHMYALWAPEISNISYVGSVIDGQYVPKSEKAWTNHADNPSQYTFEVTSNVVTIKAPTMPGYTFKGWFIYQDEGQNANWGYEPVYVAGTAAADKDYDTLDYTQMTYLEVTTNDGSYDLEMGEFLFGDITLIAQFEPAYTDLKIAKTGYNAHSNVDENQVFLFRVEGTPYDNKQAQIDMIVTVYGQGQVQIKHLPVGAYTVTEMTDWSWRYDVAENNGINVENATATPNGAESVKFALTDPAKTVAVTFNNDRTTPSWLSGDSYKENQWTIASGT